MSLDSARFSWKKDKLYYGTIHTGASVKVDLHYPDMYWIETKKGNSEDFYNKSRAKDLAVYLTTEDLHLKGGNYAF